MGELSGNHLSKVIQDKCGAGHLRVDASSKSFWAAEMQWRSPSDKSYHAAGSFAISEDSKPRVINLDFPVLPVGKDRGQKLIENGMRTIAVRLGWMDANVYQTPSSPLSLICSHRTSSLSSILLRLPTLLTKRPLMSPSRTRWMLNSRRPCTWTSNETSRMTSARLMAISHCQRGPCSKDTNISAQVYFHCMRRTFLLV